MAWCKYHESVGQFVNTQNQVLLSRMLYNETNRRIIVLWEGLISNSFSQPIICTGSHSLLNLASSLHFLLIWHTFDTSRGWYRLSSCRVTCSSFHQFQPRFQKMETDIVASHEASPAPPALDLSPIEKLPRELIALIVGHVPEAVFEIRLVSYLLWHIEN